MENIVDESIMVMLASQEVLCQEWDNDTDEQWNEL